MKQLKWINLLLICIIYFLACKKNDLHQNKINKNDPDLLTVKFHNQNVHVKKKGNLYFLFDDVAFDQQTFDSLRNLYEKSPTIPRSVYNPTIANHWPNGNVYYKIDPSQNFTDPELQRINAAIAHWQTNTSLKFIQRTNQPNFINFERLSITGSGGVHEGIGMKGTQQFLRLFGNFSTGIVIHEIGHAIGFYHEQSRSDRDDWVVVNWQNIADSYQFQTYIERNQPGADFGPFDWNSIMLYGSDIGSSNGQHTMVRKSDNQPFFNFLTGLSQGDINAAAYIYGPPFVRIITTQNQVLELVTGGGTDLYRYRDRHSLRFFLDEACTIPYTGSNPCSVTIKTTNTIKNYGDPSTTTYSSYQVYTITNTTQDFDLGWTEEQFIHEEFGYLQAMYTDGKTPVGSNIRW